jgi:tetratricopeptide (TPR) repeat protein
MSITRRWGKALVMLAFTAAAAGGQGAGGMPIGRQKLDTAGVGPIKKKETPAVKLQTQDSCKLVLDTPDDVKDAASQLTFAGMQASNPAKSKEYLGKAVGKLTYKADRYSKNPMGQEFMLGQSLVLWTKVPGTTPVMKKGDLGFSTDKDQTIDLLHAADSLFSNVEKEFPKCQGETDDFRRQAWGPYITKVGPLINANNIDSASKLLDQSLVIYRGSPFSYYFKGQIEYRRDQFAQASTSFEQAQTLAVPMLATNSDLPGIAEYSSFFAGYSAEKAAMIATGADQAALYKRAATLLAKNLKDYPCGRFSENAETTLFSALSATNDTVGMRTQLTAMTTETKPCSDMWWYNAAREASEMDAMPIAVQLADKAVAYSPWSAGLGNAAGVYLKAKEFTKLLPVAARLTQIAPNSQDDWDLLALGYQGAAAAATVPATKQAYKDSLLVAYNAGQKNAVHVRVSEFSMDGTKRLAGGYVELVDNNPANQPVKPAKKGAAKGAKSAASSAPAASSMGPKQVTIKMDFLDQAGAVVASQSTTVTAKVGEQTKFSMTADGDKIVGYRYAPIP